MKRPLQKSAIASPEPTTRHDSNRRRVMQFLALAGSVCLLVSVLDGLLAYAYLVARLPDVTSLDAYTPSVVSEIYDRHGQLLANFYVEQRRLVPLKGVPLHVRLATIAAEDRRFYRHGGIDFQGILRAFWVNLRAGETREGASTITQQLARSLFLTRERTVFRKISEALLARRLERRYSKDRLLELYINQTFYGHSAYGIEAAAQLYFGKSAHDLTLAEGALIAGLPPAPNVYSPLKNPDRSVQRRAQVLRRMVAERYLGEAEAARAAREPLRLLTAPHAGRINHAPYFVEYVRQYVADTYGEDALHHTGLKVYTTLDLSLQRAAVHAVQNGVLRIDKRVRRGTYERPVRRLELTQDTAANEARIRAVTFPDGPPSTIQQGDLLTGVVLAVQKAAIAVAVQDGHGSISPVGWRWVRKVRGLKARRRLHPRQYLRRGDVIRVRVTHVDPAGQDHGLALAYDPDIQGALVALEAGSGHILAMVGGYDFATSQFNRAVQAYRQPGSAFKPLVYAAALERGLRPDSMVKDTPLTRTTPEGKRWTPLNYDNTFWGPITLRMALAHSRNVATVRVSERVGLQRICAYVVSLGLKSPVRCYPSLALGASSVTLLDLSAVYGVFANRGLYAPPLFVTKIVDRTGTVVEAQKPRTRRVMRRNKARIVTHLLEGVVHMGTGRSVQALGRPAAGKTGTTDGFHDAWFIGYTPEIITGVWVGRDNATPIGQRETGARAAIPIWTTFMRTALQGKPVTTFAPGPYAAFRWEQRTPPTAVRDKPRPRPVAGSPKKNGGQGLVRPLPQRQPRPRSVAGSPKKSGVQELVRPLPQREPRPRPVAGMQQKNGLPERARPLPQQKRPTRQQTLRARESRPGRSWPPHPRTRARRRPAPVYDQQNADPQLEGGSDP